MSVNQPVKRGQCGTCHWFEIEERAPLHNGFSQGQCCVNPPVPSPAMMQAPGSAVMRAGAPQGPQMHSVTMGLRPPTVGNARCHKWIPTGTFPAPDRLT